MKDRVDEIIRETYHQGKQMPEGLNRRVLRMANEKQKENSGSIDGGSRNDQRQVRSGWQKAAVAAALVAVVLTAGAGGAYAATHYLGIQDFWGKSGSHLSEDARKLIESHPAVTMDASQKNADILNYEVDSVLCDSKYVTAIVNVDIKDQDKYLLVLDPEDLTSSVSALGIDEGSDLSIAKYCEKKGLIPVQLYLQEKDAKDAEVVSRDMKQLSGAKGVIEINAKRRSKKQKFQLTIQPLLMLNNSSETHYDPTIKIDVKDNSTEKSAYYVMQDQKENTVHGTKVTLKEVKLTTTEVASYLSARYEEKGVLGDASASWLQLCDEDGKPVSFGGMDGGRCYEAGKNEYVSEGSYESIGLPEKIYLSIGDYGEIVELTKQEK